MGVGSNFPKQANPRKSEEFDCQKIVSVALFTARTLGTAIAMIFA